ncbi:hypothetical protein [Streptomyces sp. V1I6]|uniref:hypothetical protein n=1 Tax=Streptomyces sp. V1I6 TaxID=3042273 RepID=UPI0027811230|nr:hypothetical protein [Streptomyces sp. V1I6]MDQ0847688.1 hypothetical protein [Streptomyces sp. V1I6]
MSEDHEQHGEGEGDGQPPEQDGKESAEVHDEPSAEADHIGSAVSLPDVALDLSEVTNALRLAQEAWQQTDAFRSITASLQRIQSEALASLPDLSHMAPRIDWPQFRQLAETFEGVWRSYERIVPANWRGRSLDYKAMTTVIEEGIPLTWIPPGNVVAELLDASDARARLLVLESNRSEIITACGAALDEVTDPSLEHQAALLKDCVAMAHAGLPTGAQALAASVFDTVYRGIWRAQPDLNAGGNWFKYKQVTQRLPEIDHDESTVLEFRQSCALAPIKAACAEFREGEPIPAVFNRHATAHAAGRTQYTGVNALVAVMLSVSLVRELQEGSIGALIHS